ncbi:MAG: glycosyltransferase [Bacteroidia bacterium]|nr:glycosyltransferase [Bacteroidia bacterium]
MDPRSGETGLSNISVIIPTLNSSGYISNLLKSLLKQTLSPSAYEIIVIDNGSTDKTAEVLTDFSHQAKNLRWVTEPYQGRARARNRGIRESDGELILFIDDDMEIESDHLERHLSYHQASNVPVAVLGNITDLSPVSPGWLKDYYDARQLIAKEHVKEHVKDIAAPTGTGLQFIAGNVSLLRSTLALVKLTDDPAETYFDPALVRRQDGDMGIRLIGAGVRFLFAHDLKCSHRHPRNLRSLLKRSYEVGYYTSVLIQKHPEISHAEKHLTKSGYVNSALLLACIVLFVPAYLLHLFWTYPLNKVTGGILRYQTNRGYQQAQKDHSR